MLDLIINTDGASRGNPGPAAIGVVIRTKDGRVRKEFGEYLGRATNNVAEYTAIVRALEEAKKLIPADRRHTAHIEVRLDSELAARQLRGVYRVKNAALVVLHARICDMRAKDLPHITFTHVRRELNADADALANAALDARHAAR